MIERLGELGRSKPDSAPGLDADEAPATHNAQLAEPLARVARCRYSTTFDSRRVATRRPRRPRPTSPARRRRG